MKRYVDVIVRWREDGQIIPLQLNWALGQEFVIDRVLEIRQSASLKAGGQGRDTYVG